MPSYQAMGQRYEVTLHPLTETPEGAAVPTAAFAARATHARRGVTPRHAPRIDGNAIVAAVAASSVLRTRVSHATRLAVVQGAAPSRAIAGARRPAATAISTASTMCFATETIIVEGMRQADIAAAKNYGATVIDEGLDGKTLIRVDSVERVFGLVNLLLERQVGSATPNFIRQVSAPRPSAPAAAWSHAKMRVAEAWAITRGSSDVHVAVLDEGVDTSHPSLKRAVVAQRDFIGGNGDSAMPDGDDAHGTACAGVVLSRDDTYPGIAPQCGLIAARIAMGDSQRNWIFDDFATADAIDWCWRQGAAVLSNSWTGGAPSDAISRAFARARTQGRNGLGAVIAIAAGNTQEPIQFPGDLPGYVTVGASTPDDQRKTRTSSDGEDWWGSCFGATLQLLAPGVFIWTTDIAGRAGYSTGDFTKTFNGTSSATPAVAGAAALMISANPAISASSVRELLGKTAKKIARQKTWTKELGWGRLDVAAVVTAAASAGSTKVTKSTKKKTTKTKSTKTTKTTKTTKKKATKTKKTATKKKRASTRRRSR